MNTSTHIREETNMQPSSIMHDAPEIAEIDRYVKAESIEQLNDIEFTTDTENISQSTAVGDYSIETSPCCVDQVESSESDTVKTVNENIDTSELIMSDECVSNNIVSPNQAVQNSDLMLVGDNLDVTDNDIETEKIEITDHTECSIQQIVVDHETTTDSLYESPATAIPETTCNDGVPETLMQKVDEISHSMSKNVHEETISDEFSDAIIKPGETNKNILDQVGHLTRNLHNSLRELGYDKRLESLVSEVPEAQDKLTYVATKTEQAAERVLNATETTMPIQEKLSSDATNLREKWKSALEEQRTQPNTEKFKQLLIETLSFIDKVPEQADATNAQLMEIMMAQDFQDLTGQVIKKITYMVQRLEHDLVQLLLANVPHTNKQKVANEGLMNGPVTNPEKSADTVSNQDQVDDLLASLGF